jgi:hypothetical protein
MMMHGLANVESAMNYLLFWDVALRRLVVADVSEETAGPVFMGSLLDPWNMDG